MSGGPPDSGLGADWRTRGVSRHCYSARALSGDYLRSGIGFLVTGGPVLLMETAPAVTVALTALACLFSFFGLRVVLRQITVIEANEQAIEARGIGGTRLAWNAIDEVRLDYYSTRRDGRGGWMQMKVSGPDGRIRAESNIGEFESLAAAVAAQTQAHVGMSDTTLGNFRALGITIKGRENVATP